MHEFGALVAGGRPFRILERIALHHTYARAASADRLPALCHKVFPSHSHEYE